MAATFRASGDMLISLVIALVSQWMLKFPLAYILSKHTKLHASGLWRSFPVTNIVVAIVAAVWFAQGSWKKTRLTEQEKQVAIITDETIVEDGLP